MKLRDWLKEHKNISYAEYKSLPDMDRWGMEGEFQSFNRKQILIKQAKERMQREGVTTRKMTDEEYQAFLIRGEKERKRYEDSRRIGGIDERGNYTALHHRWDEHRR
ncbi:MAG: hypothetical protein Q4D21_09525 [Phascolarctobacterium sp.]|nr:hypothetical protein [Phascolarctobacterium sp.]